ncbi:MAG: hypothetical protein SFW67_28220 [Myxococcaceae bacterium]|nr:hypothetical protein [Myxococcaceae bacterium]
MSALDALEPFGLLPLAVPLLLLSSHRLAHGLLSGHSRLDRLAGCGVVAMGLVHALVGTLGTFGFLTTNALLAALLVVTVVALLLTRDIPVTGWWRIVRRHPLAVGLALAPLVLAGVAARLVPVWQWDSIGYHLPFVHFVIQAKGFAGVPPDLHYISTYPHDIELGMIALRLMLPDDRLVDLAQVPYGLVGAVLTAAIARKLQPVGRTLPAQDEGAPARQDRQYALLAGALWLVVPCVFLQLPTNYVDVGTAAALLGAVYFIIFPTPSWRTLLLGGVSLGVFLGSKPSAPLATVMLGAVAMWRWWAALNAARAAAGVHTGRSARPRPAVGLDDGGAARRRPRLRHLWAAFSRWRSPSPGSGASATRGLAIGAVLFVAAVLVFGAEMYLVMLARHGNPVWPVAVKLGPWTLPGTHAVDELLAAGAALPSVQGSLLERLTVSWIAVTTPPVFDMKLGGLGLPFLVALPFAVVGLVRRRSVLLGVVLLATLASPNPSFGRYVLAFAALVVALALAELEHLAAPRWAMGLGAATLVAVQLWWSAPGLTGDGPDLATLWSLTDEQRRVAVGPHGPPTDYPRVWDAVNRGETVAFDEGFEFPGLLWSPTLQYVVRSVPALSDSPALEPWAEEQRVRVLAVSAERAKTLDPSAWRKLFDCKSTPCAVYLRQGPAVSARP